jgi:hypothetical protein
MPNKKNVLRFQKVNFILKSYFTVFVDLGVVELFSTLVTNKKNSFVSLWAVN